MTYTVRKTRGREVQVLDLRAKGKSYSDIAAELHTDVDRVKYLAASGRRRARYWESRPKKLCPHCGGEL